MHQTKNEMALTSQMSLDPVATAPGSDTKQMVLTSPLCRTYLTI